MTVGGKTPRTTIVTLKALRLVPGAKLAASLWKVVDPTVTPARPANQKRSNWLLSSDMPRTKVKKVSESEEKLAEPLKEMFVIAKSGPELRTLVQEKLVGSAERVDCGPDPQCIWRAMEF